MFIISLHNKFSPTTKKSNSKKSKNLFGLPKGFKNIRSKFAWQWLSLSKFNEYDKESSKFFNGKLISSNSVTRTITNIDFQSINLTYYYDDFEILEFYNLDNYATLPDPYIKTIMQTIEP